MSPIAIQKLHGPPEKAKTGQSATLFPAGVTASLQFGNIEELAAAIKQWNHEGIQLAPGSFRARLDLVHTASMQIHRVQLSPAILVRGFAVPGAVVLGIQSGGTQRAKWRGHAIATDDVITFDGEKEIDLHFNGPSEVIAISFDRQLLAQHAEANCGGSHQSHPENERLKVLSPEKVAALARTWTELTNASLQLGNELIDSTIARQLEAKIVEAVFANVSYPVHLRDLTERRCVAQRARRFMIDNMDAPMTITDICASVGTCERTLHVGFRECFDITPKKFLKVLRLNAARRSLQNPSADTTVTKVALRCGFFHLARFAGDYRRLFGETPSETLRRVCGIAQGVQRH